MFKLLAVLSTIAAAVSAATAPAKPATFMLFPRAEKLPRDYLEKVVDDQVAGPHVGWFPPGSDTGSTNYPYLELFVDTAGVLLNANDTATQIYVADKEEDVQVYVGGEQLAEKYQTGIISVQDGSLLWNGKNEWAMCAWEWMNGGYQLCIVTPDTNDDTPECIVTSLEVVYV